MGQRGIDVALDLSRIPSLARTCGTMPIPGDILDTLQIAAEEEEACSQAMRMTGETAEVLVAAARFYLQHLLFSTRADYHRVLGLTPGASRQTARLHMKLLLEWLHPDRNSGLESVYADRVIEAWQKLAVHPSDLPVGRSNNPAAMRRTRLSRRPPLVSLSSEISSKRRSTFRSVKVIAGALLLVGLGSSVAYYFAPELYKHLIAWKP